MFVSRVKTAVMEFPYGSNQHSEIDIVILGNIHPIRVHMYPFLLPSSGVCVYIHTHFYYRIRHVLFHPVPVPRIAPQNTGPRNLHPTRVPRALIRIRHFFRARSAPSADAPDICTLRVSFNDALKLVFFACLWILYTRNHVIQLLRKRTVCCETALFLLFCLQIQAEFYDLFSQMRCLINEANFPDLF